MIFLSKFILSVERFVKNTLRIVRNKLQFFLRGVPIVT